MVGEPSASEYGKAISEYNKKVSTDYCKCTHNNVGWVGCFVTTPNNKYCIVTHNSLGEDVYYTVNKYNGGTWDYPSPLIKEKFRAQEEALNFIEKMNM